MKKENPSKWEDVSAKIPYAVFSTERWSQPPLSVCKFSPGAANRSSAILGAAAPGSFSKNQCENKIAPQTKLATLMAFCHFACQSKREGLSKVPDE